MFWSIIPVAGLGHLSGPTGLLYIKTLREVPKPHKVKMALTMMPMAMWV